MKVETDYYVSVQCEVSDGLGDLLHSDPTMTMTSCRRQTCPHTYIHTDEVIK